MTDAQISCVVDVHDAIQSGETRRAFFHLLIGTTGGLGLHPLPLRRGVFSGIHLATRRNATPYGDAEFAFKGATQHIRWWFRGPAFKTGLIQEEDVAAVFRRNGPNPRGEMTCDIATFAEADRLLAFLKPRVRAAARPR